MRQNNADTMLYGYPVSDNPTSGELYQITINTARSALVLIASYAWAGVNLGVQRRHLLMAFLDTKADSRGF
jgi:hypothetical protein